MASDQALPTHDLRSAAVEQKRYKSHTAKWAHGEQPLPGRGWWPDDPLRQIKMRINVDPTDHTKTRPQKPRGRWQYDLRFEDREATRLGKQGKAARKLSLPGHNATDSEISEDDVFDVDCKPSPDEEITYSYDAPRGPQAGQNLLGIAVAQAVEKFEGKETEKLVKEEYDVVPFAETSATQGSSTVQPVTADDDFELI